MAKFFADLIAELKGSREGVLPSIQSFPPLDVEQISRELDIERKAIASGSRDLPPCDDDVEEITELDIRSEIERRARKSTEDYRSQRDLYELRIRRALISADQVIKIESAGQGALANFEVQVTNDLNHLHLELEDLREREREFNAFRSKHNLGRLPYDIGSHRRTLGYSLLALFVVLESMLNGLFFAKGSEAGLIGGVVQAFGFALLNITVAVLFARFPLRLVVHRKWAAKFAGIVSILIYVVWVLALNLWIAHFRDLFIETSGNVAMADLLAKLKEAPFALADPASGLLAALGMSISVIAAIDVAFLDDLYPGFGAVGRRKTDATRRYADAQSDCLVALEATRNEAIKDMEAVIDLMRDAELELRLALDGRTTLYRNYKAYLDHAVDAYTKLVQLYRQANRSARTKPCVPGRFRQVPSRPEFLVTGPLEAFTEMGRDERLEALSKVDRFIGAVNDKYQAAAKRFQSVAAVTNSQSAGHATA